MTKVSRRAKNVKFSSIPMPLDSLSNVFAAWAGAIGLRIETWWSIDVDFVTRQSSGWLTGKQSSFLASFSCY